MYEIRIKCDMKGSASMDWNNIYCEQRNTKKFIKIGSPVKIDETKLLFFENSYQAEF